MPVQYTGVLPDLFREGQSIIATGSMQGNHFTAREVLAACAESLTPVVVEGSGNDAMVVAADAVLDDAAAAIVQAKEALAIYAAAKTLEPGRREKAQATLDAATSLAARVTGK